MAPTLHLHASNPADLATAAGLLRRGGTVAFATETVYGLGAHALDAEAVAKIFAAKQRPAWDPLIVHVAEPEQVDLLTHVPPDLRARVDALAAAFWPGPLTLLLPRNGLVPEAVTAGRPLVGVRIPAHLAAHALLRAAGVPVAAPSANRFGHTSPTTAEHVLADLEGRIDAVLDAGPAPVGVESTVLDPTQTPMVLYRPGAISAEALEQVTGVTVRVHAPSADEQAAAPESLPSPGVGIRHYAPRARLLLAEGSAQALRKRVEQAVVEAGRVGVLRPAEWPLPAGPVVFEWGAWESSGELAARLFAGLRWLDEQGVDAIVAPLPDAGGGLYEALRDRMNKAARSGQAS